MRHRRLGRKLGVTTKHRRSMLRNMVTDFLRNGSVKTTDTRAKELRRVSEKIITLARRGSLHSRRRAAAFIRDKDVLRKLFGDIAQKYKDRPGGYTRIVKIGFRKGDNAPLSILELVEEDLKPKTKKKARVKEKQKMPEAAIVDVKSTKKESAKELGLIEKEGDSKPGELTSKTGAVPQTEEKTQPSTDEEGQTVPEQEPEAKEDKMESEAEQTADHTEKEEKIKAEAELGEKREDASPEEAETPETKTEEDVEKQEFETTEVKAAEAEESREKVDQARDQIVEESVAQQTEEAPKAATQEKMEAEEPQAEKVETPPDEVSEPEVKAEEPARKTEESQEGSDEDKFEEEKKES